MTYNLKQDWEKTKQILAQAGKDLQYNQSSQIWNGEMTNLLNAYKQEEIAWYNSRAITENGFYTATQNLWYTHYLNKKRLCSLGLTARYDYIKLTDTVKGENQRFPQWNYSHDGKNLICKISDAMTYRKSFLSQGRVIWADECRGLPGEYYIIQSRSMNGKYICPNCGSEDILENFKDGCDYCQTKFQIDDLKQKVSSVYIPKSQTQHRNGFTIHKNFFPMYFILLIAIFVLIPILTDSALGTPNMLPMFLGFIAIVIFLSVVIGKTAKESRKSGPAKTRQTLDELRKVDNCFSEEAFIGNLSNKLMSICYADSMAEVSPFAECDLTTFISAHRGVIDCKMLECVLMNYHTDGRYQHLEVKTSIGLTACSNGRIIQNAVTLNLGLVKSLSAVTQSMSDVNVYQCHSCGSSLSLLNGGRCEYCDNRLDLKQYDWVISHIA